MDPELGFPEGWRYNSAIFGFALISYDILILGSFLTLQMFKVESFKVVSEAINGIKYSEGFNGADGAELKNT